MLDYRNYLTEWLNSPEATAQPRHRFVQGEFAARLDQNNIPQVGLTQKEREDLTHELLWQLADRNDISYLKSNKVDLWDQHFDRDSLFYADYSAADRAQLHGSEEQRLAFLEAMKQYLSKEALPYWTPVNAPVVHKTDADGNFTGHGEIVIEHYLHPDIEELGHRWLDEQGIGGARQEPIFGQMQNAYAPNLKAQLVKFMNAPSEHSVEIIKRYPGEQVGQLFMHLAKTAITNAQLAQLILNANLAPTLEEAAPLVDEYRDRFPSEVLYCEVNLVEASDIGDIDGGVFQAGVLARLVCNTLNLMPDRLHVRLHNFTLHPKQMSVKLDKLNSEDPGPAHLFFAEKVPTWHEYTFPMFDYQ